jgi:hypothetical protein
MGLLASNITRMKISAWLVGLEKERLGEGIFPHISSTTTTADITNISRTQFEFLV